MLTSVLAHGARYGWILLVLYLASVALVCSFILFEVLDIDGSDFLPLSPLVDARPAESHHEDLKRAILAGVLVLITQALPRVAHRLTLCRVERRVVVPALRFTPSRATLALLPRATLGDGAAA